MYPYSNSYLDSLYNANNPFNNNYTSDVYQGKNSIKRVMNGFQICLSKRVTRILSLSAILFGAGTLSTILHAILPVFAVIPVLIVTSFFNALGRDTAITKTHPVCLTVTLFPIPPSISLRVQAPPGAAEQPVLAEAPLQDMETGRRAVEGLGSMSYNAEEFIVATDRLEKVLADRGYNPNELYR